MNICLLLSFILLLKRIGSLIILILCLNSVSCQSMENSTDRGLQEVIKLNRSMGLWPYLSDVLFFQIPSSDSVFFLEEKHSYRLLDVCRIAKKSDWISLLLAIKKNSICFPDSENITRIHCPDCTLHMYLNQKKFEKKKSWQLYCQYKIIVCSIADFLNNKIDELLDVGTVDEEDLFQNVRYVNDHL